MVSRATYAGLSPITLVVTLGVAGVIIVAALYATQDPALYRLLVALVLGGALVVVAVRHPRAAIILTLGFLVTLALIRRLLIPLSGWTSYDPLLLVAPLISVVLLIRALIKKHRLLATDGVSKLITTLAVVILLQTLNPAVGGPLAGLAGLLFLGAPLLWFFVGREIADRHTVWALQWVIILAAVGAAIYGLAQAELGFPAWDAAWLQTAGYTSLHVLGGIRPFGPFSSSAEFATYVAVGLVLALAMAVNRRWVALVAIPLLAAALFLDSSRTLVIMATMAAIILGALRLGKWLGKAPVALAALVVAVALLIGATRIVGPSLEASAASAHSPLLAHQLGGLLHPLDPNQSTLGLHVQAALDGLRFSLSNPLGLGTAVTNSAGDTLGSPGLPTELDVVDALVALGLLGGILFLAVVVAVFRQVILMYLRRDGITGIGVLAVFVVTLGQWLNGGHYAVAPLVWLLAGWVVAETTRDRAGGGLEGIEYPEASPPAPVAVP